MEQGIKLWWDNLWRARKYTPKKCTCGEREICTQQFYYTNRGGMGIDGGIGECGKIRNKIKKANKYMKKECT